MAALPEDDVPTMTSLELKREVEQAGGSPPPAAGRAMPVAEEEEEHTAQHVLELVDSTAIPSSLPASSSPVTEEDELEDSITATAPTIDPQTRAPMFDAAKLASVRIEIPAESPRPPALPPRPSPVASTPSPETRPSGAAPPPQLEPIEPADETEARTVPGRSPADDEPPTAQGLVAPLTPRTPVKMPLSAVPSTEPAIEDDDEDPTAHGISSAAPEVHPADEDDAPTGQGPAPEVAAHPADEDDAPTGQGPAPAVVTHPADEDDAPTGQGPAPVTAEDYEPDDSITGLAPNISKLSLSNIAATAPGSRSDGELPDLTEGTTSKMRRPREPAAELPADALDDDDDEATASITAEAPAPMTNMLRVIASEGAPPRTKPMSAIAPIEQDDLPRDKTAVMASAPLRAAARAHQPTSDSGLRARADSTSGERPSAQLAPGFAVSHPPSEGLMPVPSAPGSSRGFDPPAPWDTPAAPAPRYGALVGFVATVSICFPIALYFLLRSNAPPPTPPEPARVEISVNPLASSPPLVKPPHPAPPPPEASASASASAPPPTRTPPRRRTPVRRGPRRR